MSAREALIETALRLLAEEGLPAPADLARATGVSKALVFHHFGTLEGLRDAMAARVLQETQEGLDALAREEPNPRARVEALARALLAEPPDEPAQARRVVAFWLADDGRGGCRGALRDALLVDFVRATLRGVRTHATPEDVAALLLARWHGATVLYASGGAVDFEREQGRVLSELRAVL